MSTFFDLSSLGLATSSDQSLQTWLDAMQAAYPGYTPGQANLEYILAQTFSSWAADLGNLASSGSSALFQTFGTTLLGVQFQTGAAAMATVSITAADNTGGIVSYTLPEGTQFTLDTLAFASSDDITVAAGASAQVNLVAIEQGSSYNGAGSGGSVQLLSQIDWIVGTPSIVASASGGIDAESDDHYLNRLVATATTMAQRPITATDYATMSLNFNPLVGTDQQEVGRATAVDGYDPAESPSAPNAGGTLSSGNEREITIAVTDANGVALNMDTKVALQQQFQNLREANFIVNVVDPTYTPIYVTVSAVAATGFSTVTVQQNIQTALLTYLNPANWGFGQANNQVGWTNSLTLYQSQIESQVQTTPGVDHIVAGTLKFGIAATPTNTTDLTLSGPVALPTSSVSTIPLSSITVT